MQPTDDQPTVGFTAPPSLAAVSVRYELLGEIGRGGMGIVYKARDRRTGDLVALKAIHPSTASDPHLIERFTNELLLARRITHKNVCRVHDLNDFGGTLVISMELVKGRSLRQLLQDVEAVSIRQGVKIARQIAAGLAEAHACGVVHRDLKPENILVARDGAVKIMDFGIARLADSRLTVTGQLIGTPAYMSPEQAEGKPADARSDIYSLGLVLYEMFCGQPAFSGETPLALVGKRLSAMPVAPREIEADLPVRIDEAIRKCLEKDPERRFQSVLDLDAALSAGTAGSSDTPEGETKRLPARVDRWQRTDWALVAAAAAGLTIFFASFSRVSLAPQSQVTFDRAVLHRIAEEHLQRLGVSTSSTQVGGAVNPGQYVYVATTYGAAFAREAANNPVHYWTWSVAFDGGSLEVDNHGRLTSFVRRPVPIDPGVRSIDDARRQAMRAVEDFFGQPASALVPEHETRGQVYEFTWLGPDASRPLRMRYTASIDNAGVSSLVAGLALPPGYSLGSFPFGEVTMNEWGLPIAVVIGVFLCTFGFVNRRRVAAFVPWRSALVIVAFVAAAGYSVAGFQFIGPGDSIAVPLALGVLLSIVVYLGSIAVEVVLTKSARRKLETFTALFGRWRRAEGSGLAILRGSLVGLVLLGVDTLIIWIATTWFGGRLSMIHAGLMGGIINFVVWPVGIVLGACALQMAGLSLLVAFADGVAARVPVRPWLSVTGVTSLLAASGIRLSMAAVQPVRFTVVALFVDFGLLVLAFRAFDLLTLCTAIGTFALWWANYPLLVMQQPIGAAGPWSVFVGWGVFVLVAAVLAFKSRLGRGYECLVEN